MFAPLSTDIYLRMCSEFAYDPKNETGLVKELVLQVRKVIGPFAAPKKIFIVSDLPKTRSGKVRMVSNLYKFRNG
jgi:acetyl-CoA synthetase